VRKAKDFYEKFRQFPLFLAIFVILLFVLKIQLPFSELKLFSCMSYCLKNREFYADLKNVDMPSGKIPPTPTKKKLN
jgi:hypothetical protein